MAGFDRERTERKSAYFPCRQENRVFISTIHSQPRKMKMFRTANRILLIMSILAALALTACRYGGFYGGGRAIRGSGIVIEEARAVSGFSGVGLATIGLLSIEVGDTESLRIVAEDNLVDFIETDVRGRELTIRSADGVNLRPKSSIRYYLTVKELNEISIYSSGDIQAQDLRAGDFSVNVSSSGNLDIGDLEADTLHASINSSGDVRIGVLKADTIDVNINSSGDLDIAGGEVQCQNIKINSSGDYRASEMESDEAEAHLNSSGSATIRVRNRLKAGLNSSGDLRYRGNPAVDVKKNSSGDIKRI
jgi:hypothetical protein